MEEGISEARLTDDEEGFRSLWRKELDSEGRDKGLHRKREAQDDGSTILQKEKYILKEYGMLDGLKLAISKAEGAVLYWGNGFLGGTSNGYRTFLLAIFWRGALRTAHGFGGGCGEQKCSYDIRGCHTTLKLIYQVVICEEELLLQGFMRCTLLYTTVAGTTVPEIRNFDP